MTNPVRTPEGEPLRCPICGAISALDLADPPGDAVCPQCGSLLWRIRDRLQNRPEKPAADHLRDFSWNDECARDSPEMVEIVMELEDEFDLSIPEADYAQFRSVRDVVQYLRRRRGDLAAE